MSDPIDISSPSAYKSKPRSRSEQFPSSPLFGSPNFQLPSPIITKRNRTFSLCEKAAAAPEVSGKVKFFCRNKGHGFIKPDNGSDDLFFHISDIEGEYAPMEGDEVKFRLCPVPPKNEKYQATHVTILNVEPGTHETWDSPSSPRH